MTSDLQLIKLLSLGNDTQDVGFCSLRVEQLIERLHRRREKKEVNDVS